MLLGDPSELPGDAAACEASMADVIAPQSSPDAASLLPRFLHRGPSVTMSPIGLLTKQIGFLDRNPQAWSIVLERPEHRRLLVGRILHSLRLLSLEE